jgi:hypothetical protein
MGQPPRRTPSIPNDEGTQQRLVELNPVEPLTALALGQAMGKLAESAVLERERAAELFSVTRPRGNHSRMYPAFQAWHGIAGSPLRCILTTLAKNEPLRPGRGSGGSRRFECGVVGLPHPSGQFSGQPAVFLRPARLVAALAWWRHDGSSWLPVRLRPRSGTRCDPKRP